METSNIDLNHPIYQNGVFSRFLEKAQDVHTRAIDIGAHVDELQINTSDDTSTVILERNGEPTRFFDVDPIANGQIAETLKMPVRRFQQLKSEHPKLFDDFVQTHWQNSGDKKVLLRGLDTPPGRNSNPTLRAYKSDRYKVFDNLDLLSYAMPVIQDMEATAQWRVASADITETKMYLRMRSERITGEPAVGDLMALGIGFTNSEVGMGAVGVYQMFYTLACLNGMQSENRQNFQHLGKSIFEGDDAERYLSRETKAHNARGLGLTFRDVLSGYASRESFDEMLEKMSGAHGDIIEGEFSEVIDRFVSRENEILKRKRAEKDYMLGRAETAALFTGLTRTMDQPGYVGKPVSRAALINATTAVAHTVDPDRVDEWQKRGNDLLNISPAQWEKIAVAA